MPEADLARAIVRDAIHRYIAGRRERVDDFIDRHFTFAGSLALHRAALGWDLVRVPVNLFLAGPALAIKLASCAARRAGWLWLATRLARCRLLRETDLAREIAWLMATELLEIPCRQRDRAFDRDALADMILTALPIGADPESCRRLAAAIESYVGSRAATAEIATGIFAAGLGAAAVKQATPGLVTLGVALAAAIAQQTAIAAFPLGAALGALWYGWFPITADLGLLAITTAGTVIAGAMLTAFAGIAADPLRRCLGLHRRRLLRLLDALEHMLCDEASDGFMMRDHYAARLVDLVDLAAAAWRAVGSPRIA